MPRHLSKEQDIPLKAGDRVQVGTPGGGGYGNAFYRDPALVQRDVRLGYYTPEQARERFGVVIDGDGETDTEATVKLRTERQSADRP